MDKLNFYNPPDFEEAQRIGSRILAECNGMTYEEVMDRLSAKLSPGEILEKVEKVWIENIGEKDEIIEGLRPHYFVEDKEKN